MGQGVFFDKETFGEDKLLPDPEPWTDFMALYEPNTPPDQAARWQQFMREAPLSSQVKQDLYRLYNESRDYLAGMSIEEKNRPSSRTQVTRISSLELPDAIRW